MTAATAPKPDIELSVEQQIALNRAIGLEGGKCLYITGKAGTGKSVTTREFRNQKRIIVLAPTGLAAINAKGQTIHSFFGFNPSKPLGWQTHARDRRVYDVLRAADAIAIDEISMVRADLVDAIDITLRNTLGHVKIPFGGMPIVAIGDLYQIEPVVKPEDQHLLSKYQSPFFFDSSAYRQSADGMFELSKVFRQSGTSPSEVAFRDALNDIREGDLRSLQVFNDRHFRKPDGVIALCCTNRAATEINKKALEAIDGTERTYRSFSEGGFPDSDKPVADELTLKATARVMIVVNDAGRQFVNGDFGTVLELLPAGVRVEIDRTGEQVIISQNRWERTSYAEKDGELEEKPAGAFQQLPLKLGYAVTVHKSQGQTMQRAHLLLESSRAVHGLTYVALSRVTSIAGLTLERPLHPSDISVKPRVTEWVEAQRLGGLDLA